MTKRPASPVAILAILLAIAIGAVAPQAWGQVPATNGTPSDPDVATSIPEPINGNETASGAGTEAVPELAPLPTGSDPGDDGARQADDTWLSDSVQPASLTATATAVEVYCDIPDVNAPDQRIVGTFINLLTGYGDPEVSFVVLDISGAVVDPTGAPPKPLSNPAIAPVTASAPNPVNWEWGPGSFSSLTVTAVYPSLEPDSYPDSTSSLSLSCVPTPPTPTPGPPSTVDPSFTPPPPPTAADYRPSIVTEMKDINGVTIPDGATLSPGSQIYDTAIVSGLPPGTTGSVLYAMSSGNCTGSIFALGDPVPVVAGIDGVAIAPASNVFTVPGFPGGAYDWIVFYIDPVVGNVYGGCGAETFNVPLPPPSTGEGSARLTCFLEEPPVPGRAGYKVNVSPLPPTGTVEVNVTLQLGTLVFEYASVTLPPGTAQDLEFYGAYVFAWVTVIFRDDAGEPYAVVNLSGACAAAPGPTPTPLPTATPSPTLTATPTATPTPTPSATATATPTPTAPATPTPFPTTSPTPAPTATPTSTPLPSAAPTSGPTNTPAPTATPTSVPPATGTASPTVPPTGTVPPSSTATDSATDPTATGTVEQARPSETLLTLVELPNTGGNTGRTGDGAGLAAILTTAAVLGALALWIARRGRESAP